MKTPDLDDIADALMRAYGATAAVFIILGEEPGEYAAGAANLGGPEQRARLPGVLTSVAHQIEHGWEP